MSLICKGCTMYTRERFKTPCCKAEWCRACVCGVRGLSRVCLCGAEAHPRHLYISIFREDRREVTAFGMVIIVPTRYGEPDGVIVQTPRGVLCAENPSLNFLTGSLIKLKGDGTLKRFHDGSWIDTELGWLPLT